jgi:hypothetical protein
MSLRLWLRLLAMLYLVDTNDEFVLFLERSR